MSTISFDALGFSKRLRDIGVEQQRAELEAQALGDALAGQAQAIASLEAKVQSLQNSTENIITQVASKSDVDKIEGKVDLLRNDITWLKWALGVVLAGVASLIIKAFAG